MKNQPVGTILATRNENSAEYRKLAVGGRDVHRDETDVNFPLPLSLTLFMCVL